MTVPKATRKKKLCYEIVRNQGQQSPPPFEAINDKTILAWERKNPSFNSKKPFIATQQHPVPPPSPSPNHQLLATVAFILKRTNIQQSISVIFDHSASFSLSIRDSVTATVRLSPFNQRTKYSHNQSLHEFKRLLIINTDLDRTTTTTASDSLQEATLHDTLTPYQTQLAC